MFTAVLELEDCMLFQYRDEDGVFTDPLTVSEMKGSAMLTLFAFDQEYTEVTAPES